MELKLKELCNGMMDTMKTCYVSRTIYPKEMEERTYKVFDQHLLAH